MSDYPNTSHNTDLVNDHNSCCYSSQKLLSCHRLSSEGQRKRVESSNLFCAVTKLGRGTVSKHVNTEGKNKTFGFCKEEYFG